MPPSVKAPWWFWVVSALACLWNLLGVGAYISEVGMSHADRVAVYGTAMADAAAAQPAWVTGAYALAVFGGAIGSALLLLRRKLAVWPLLLSLLMVIAQQAYTRFSTDIMGSLNLGNQVMYASIPLIAIFLIWFARKMTTKSILR